MQEHPVFERLAALKRGDAAAVSAHCGTNALPSLPFALRHCPSLHPYLRQWTAASASALVPRDIQWTVMTVPG